MNWTKRSVVIAAVAGLAATSGLAYAAWSATATGTATSTALTAEAITLSAVGGVADLFPGFAGGDLSFEVSNPNPYDVQFTSLSAGTITTSDGGCAVSNISISATIDEVVTAGAVDEAITIGDAVSMVVGAPDVCQGVVFTIPVTLSGTQLAP